MLSKKTFVETINFLKEQSEKVETFNKLGNEIFGDFDIYLFKDEDRIVKLLAEAMDDRFEWLEYFIYENDYGKDLRPDSVQEADGTPIDITTAEKLYDFLAYEHEERKRSKKTRK